MLRNVGVALRGSRTDLHAGRFARSQAVAPRYMSTARTGNQCEGDRLSSFEGSHKTFKLGLDPEGLEGAGTQRNPRWSTDGACRLLIVLLLLWTSTAGRRTIWIALACLGSPDESAYAAVQSTVRTCHADVRRAARHVMCACKYNDACSDGRELSVQMSTTALYMGAHRLGLGLGQSAELDCANSGMCCGADIRKRTWKVQQGAA